MTKLTTLILSFLFVTSANANDIYVTQSGATLDLDITQDVKTTKWVTRLLHQLSLELLQQLILIKLVTLTY